MSSASPATLLAPAPALTPQDLGVGARFTVAVMDGDFAAILLAALAGADATGLEVETDPVSTLVRGSEQRVLEYISAVIAGAASGGHHVTASLLLSRGCPGEVTCSTTPGLLAEAAPVPELAPTGIRASAHWSLYPLDDTGRPGEAPDHLRDIYAAIDHAKELGTYVRGEHYATLLEGDLADVLGTVAAGWVLVGRSVQHVTSHATLSIASPTTADPTATSPTATSPTTASPTTSGPTTSGPAATSPTTPNPTTPAAEEPTDAASVADSKAV